MITEQLSVEKTNNILTDPVLAHLCVELPRRLEAHLKQLILFGSRARDEAAPDSDYDLLAIVDEISRPLKTEISAVAGDFLYDYNSILSLLPVEEATYNADLYEPLFINVRREGIVLWTHTQKN